MASNLRGYSADEVLNKVLNTSNDSIQVDIVAGAEYAEDSEHTTEDTGNFVLGVRNDTLAALGGDDGDYVPFQMNASGALYVTNASVIVDDDGFTPGTSSIQMVGAEFDESGPDSVDEGDGGAIRMSANRNLYTTIRDAAGNERGVNVNSSSQLLVDGSGVTQPVSGTVSVSGLLADGHAVTIDNAIDDEVYVRGSGSAGSADAKVLTVQGIASGTALAVTESSPISGFATSANQLAAGHTIDCNSTFIKLKDGSGTSVTSNSGKLDVCLHSEDGTAINETANALDVNIASGGFGGVVTNGGTFAVQSTLQAADGVDIGDVDVASLPASTNTLEVVGDAAENAAAAGNPVLTGGRYDSSVRTLGNTDVGALALDPTGALYTREYLGQAGSILVTGTTNAVTTGVAGTKFVAIQFLEDSTFDAGAEGLVASTAGLWPDDNNASTTIDADGGAVTGSEVFPQGMTIFGRWDGFKLDSGKVIGYLGYV